MGMINSKTSGSDEEVGTPPRSSVPNRLLDFDPRSPSTDITRTPIFVEKTPEGMIDPRSPTPGILRTPLTTLDGHNDRVPLMPRFPLEAEVDPEDSLEDTDKLLQEFDDLQQMSIKEKQTCVNSDPPNLIYQDENTTVGVKQSKTQQPKQLFSGNKKPHSFNKDITRSPLSLRNVDMNSPRNIVQRKQTKKVENAKSCMQEAVISGNIMQDKENLEI